MKNIRFFLSENFPFLIVNFSVYLNRRVFVMHRWFKLPDSSIAFKIVLSKDLTILKNKG